MASKENEKAGEECVQPVWMLSVVVPDGKGIEAMEWYKSTLCAKEQACYKNEDGTVMHGTLISTYGFSVAVEEHTPKEHMAVPVSLETPPKRATASYMYVNLPDETTVDKAVQAMRDGGAVVTHEPKDMFYGHRVGRVVDKFGVGWAFAQKCHFDPNAPFPKKYGH